jgi:hypothetical protein
MAISLSLPSVNTNSRSIRPYHNIVSSNCVPTRSLTTLSHVGMFHCISTSPYQTVSNYYSNLLDFKTPRNSVLLQPVILHVWGFPLRCCRFPFGSWISQPLLEQPWPRWGCPALLMEITNPTLSSSSPRSWLLEVEWDPGNNYRWCNCLQFNNDWSHARCTCLSYSSKSVRCWSME